MYTDKKGHLAFFVPNIPVAEDAAKVLKEIDIGASSADHGEFICVRPCVLRRFSFTLAGEAASGTSVAPTVVFTKRPTPLSSSGETVVCTLTIPSGTAIGKTVYKDVTPVTMAIGDSIEVSHTIGTGTPTGMGFAAFEVSEDPETAANNSDMIASA